MSTEHFTHTDIEMGSDRGFGLVFAAIFLLIALWPLFLGNSLTISRFAFLIVAIGFGLISLVHPKALHPLNVLWFKFGILLGKIVTPIVMMLLFVTAFTPVSLIMRALGKDNMKLKFDTSEKSYWIPRIETGTTQSSMKNQF